MLLATLCLYLLPLQRCIGNQNAEEVRCRLIYKPTWSKYDFRLPFYGEFRLDEHYYLHSKLICITKAGKEVEVMDVIGNNNELKGP